MHTPIIILAMVSTCAALDIPWSTVYLPRSHNASLRPHETKSTPPEWLFFMSTEITDPDDNSTEPLMEWDFISHMTITPQQCGLVTNIVAMLDDALQHANPEIQNFTSTALRIGSQECVEGRCPCERNRGQLRSRVLKDRLLLEVKTRSPSPNLNPPTFQSSQWSLS
jgi:hypothetical protein